MQIIMDDPNCIILLKELCESFFSPSQRKHVPTKTIDILTKKALSLLFTFKSSSVDSIEVEDPYLSIKIDIHSRLLTNEYGRNRAYVDQVDKYLQYLAKIYENSDEKAELNSLFLLLCKLSDSDCSRRIICNDLNVFQQETGSCKSNQDVGFNRINWEKFYIEPFSVKSTFDYPFYENPGTNIKFLKDFCPDFEPYSNDFTKIFDGKCKLWRFGLDRAVDPIAQDEGFVTPGSEFSSEEEISVDDDSDTSSCSSLASICNAQVLKLNRRTWEQLGKQGSSPQVPFTSELLETILHTWKIWNSSQNKTKTYPLSSPITFEELKNDILYLLFGMDSHSFYYNCMTKIFYIRNKLHVKTLTPEIVSDFCEPLMQCASYYRCLKTFVERRIILHFGPVHQIFCRSINQILNVYRYSLLSINWENIHFVSQFEGLITSLKRKLMFLVKFCFININDELNGSNFPSGVQLLNYLYDNLMKMFRSDFGFILFHIFESCCNAYFKVVSEWMFSGCFTNPENFEEFFVEIQREDEICRDWRRVSCMKIREKRVPKLLENFYKEIFLCGKSVNLLKIFTTREVLDTILQNTYPNIKCCFNKTQLDEYVLTWQQFQLKSDQHFNSRERIKTKLVKSYDAEFYEEIKRVRTNWFYRYENTRNAVPTECHLNDVVIQDKKLDQTIKDLDNKKSIKDITNLPIADDSNEQYGSDFKLDQETKTKTKQLVEFYEKLNNNLIEDGNKSPSKVTQSSSEENTPYTKNKKRQKNKMNSCEKTVPHTDSISPDSISELDITQLDVSISFGDYKCRIDSQVNTETVDNSAADTDNVVLFGSASAVHDSFGAGDCVTSKISKPVAATVLIKNILQTPAACGDALYATTKLESIKIKTKPTISAELSEYEKNKFKSTYSDHQNQLTTIGVHADILQDIKETPLSDCARNRLKIMSSSHQKQLNESNAITKKVYVETPLNVRDQNKLKVMSSEYHQRLITTNEDIKTSDSSEKQKSRELSEYERNKLKVMSSEYHVRLLDLIGQDEMIEEKLMSRNASKISERNLNQLKIMRSEYHDRLVILSDVEKANNRVDVVEETHDIEKESKQEFVENSNTKNEKTRQTTEESETSESLEPDDPVMILENTVCSNTVKENEKLQNVNKVPSQQHENILKLENYIVYQQTVFPPLMNETADSLKATADLVRDVNRTSLFYYMSQSILIPLRIQSKIVNEAVLRVFIEEEGYLNHLMVLRNYFLLSKPEFSLLLTNTIFEMTEKVKKPYLLLNNYTLSCILQQVLLAGSSKGSLSFERKLSFVIEDTVPESFNLVDIKALYCLSLNYSVKWPINVLITEAITKKYSRIFKFLMQIQRALWTLKNDFKSLKNLKLGKSIQYTQIQLYRHNMTQVVRILQEFIMREALERCWQDLIDYLTNSEISLDDLYMSHLKYVNKIMQRCFLCDTSQSCHDSILNLLSSVLKYHNSLRAGTWQRNVQVNFLYHTNFKNIRAVFEEFQKYLNDVRAKLNLLVHTRQRLYFEPLLLELSKRTLVETEL